MKNITLTNQNGCRICGGVEIETTKADKILINGKLFSINGQNQRQEGTALAMKEDKIISVGSDEQIKALISNDTEIIDCGGNTILPGLSDSHCHPAWAASLYISCDLFHIYYEKSETAETIIDKYTDRLKKYMREHNEYTIIRGIGWNLAHFNGSAGEERLPTRHDLDKICSDKPVILESYCQHNIWVNTKAIEMASINSKTRTPSSGRITREEDGYPAGMFSEMSAISLIKEGIEGYDFTVAQYKDTLRKYQKELANFYGVTMIQDCLCSENARQAYYELARDGELTLRVRGVHPIDSSKAQEDLTELRKNKDKFDVGDLYRIDTAKFFMEGEFCMLDPFEAEIQKNLNRPLDYKGEPLWTPLNGVFYVSEAMKEGMQIHIHAMGDASIKLSVDILEKAREAANSSGRDVIAHVMAIPEGYYEKMGQMNIICSCQPRWAIHDTDVEDFYIPYVGENRARKFFPIGQFTKAGCIVSYGTDFPVTPPPSPFHEIQCAMTRSVFKDAPDYERFKGRVLGEIDNLYADCVTLEEAIKSLTFNGAYQMFLDRIAGSLEVGKSADIVILNCDIEKCPVAEIYDIKATKTFFKGAVVYEE